MTSYVIDGPYKSPLFFFPSSPTSFFPLVLALEMVSPLITLSLLELFAIRFGSGFVVFCVGGSG